MGHVSSAREEVYLNLVERLNKNPVGVPMNEYLMQILHRLYTEGEAEVGSMFPLLPVTLDKISKKTGIEQNRLMAMLDGMAEKGLILELPRKEKTFYMLAPMVVRFFEYTFMRVREEVNMGELANLFEKYFNSKGVREELFGSPTKMFRTMVYERLIPTAVETEVLQYERASEIIRNSGGGALSMCSCRHKAGHLGKACGAPVEDVCTSLGNAAHWLIQRRISKPATVDDLLRVLERTEKDGLVHLGDNVLKNPAYICHCCGCCCGVLRTIRETDIMSVTPSNFIAVGVPELCVQCGACVEHCHINAVEVEPENRFNPNIKQHICIGCGVCASVCPTGAISLIRRSDIITPPRDKGEQFSRIASEKGR